MRLEYDEASDMAYLSLVDIKPGAVKRCIPCDGPHTVALDYDRHGKLLGIEFFDARDALKIQTLMEAMPTRLLRRLLRREGGTP